MEVTETNDGVAGMTGMRWKVLADGKWTLSAVQAFQTEPVASGRLNSHEMAALLAVLHKYELASLQVNGENTNNPHRVTIKAGGRMTSLRGPAAEPSRVTVPGRVSAILGIVKLLAN